MNLALAINFIFLFLLEVAGSRQMSFENAIIVNRFTGF